MTSFPVRKSSTVVSSSPGEGAVGSEGVRNCSFPLPGARGRDNEKFKFKTVVFSNKNDQTLIFKNYLVKIEIGACAGSHDPPGLARGSREIFSPRRARAGGKKWEGGKKEPPPVLTPAPGSPSPREKQVFPLER